MPLDDTGFRERFAPLDKIDRVIDLLASEERWCQRQLATADGRRCIMGAIQAVDGAGMLTRPVSIAVRQVTGHHFSRLARFNIQRFNDDALTTHGLVMAVLLHARENIITGIAQGNAASTWRIRLSRFYRLLSVS